MRSRIALAILGTAVAALVLAGLLTGVVLLVTGRHQAEDRVADQAVALAEALAPQDGERIGLRSRALARLGEAFEVDELTVAIVLPDDEVVGEDLPTTIRTTDLVAAARDGEVRQGRRGGRAWAVAPVDGVLGDQGGNVARRLRGGVVVVLATDPARASVPPAVPRAFAWVALGTVVVGAGVALLLARGLTRPLRRAEEATGRIAAGDLTARVPEPPPGTASEVADLSRSVNDMAAALERSRGVESQFLLSVSHDLRTPLTSIRGWAEAIGDGTAPDPARAAAIIGSEARRLDRLVGDLLLLGRLEARQFTLVPTTVELGPLVGDVVAGLVPDAEAADLALTVDDRSGGAEVVLDPDRLAQVVANLVENALKFAATTVVVTVDPGTVTVADDGPGIADEDLPHVFERLYVSRQRPARRESGSGLGLAIVRELVTAMGGTVEAASADRGTRMVVTLASTPEP